MAPHVAAFASAKINLALHVLRRRADGYHDLDTVAAFCGIGDRVEVAAAEEFSLDVAGPAAAHAPAGEDNLVARAAALLAETAGRDPAVRIRLLKRLPAGAGFGGGSADAAATLHALNQLWRCGLGVEDLARIGVALGADVPMSVHATALRAGGIGERIEPIGDLPPISVVLVWPGAALSTARIFAALEPAERSPLPDRRGGSGVVDWLAASRNDLEAPAVAACPAVGEALAALRGLDGCRLARMSGSGSGCFGLFDDDHQAAARAGATLRAARPDWWTASARAA